MKADIIVALDVGSAKEAEAAVKKIGSAVSFYKVGLELFIADGVETLAMLRGQGKRIFLDLKLHDIPRTVERSVKSAMRFGAELLTIHASGGAAMVCAAAEASEGRVKIVAVTVLTSLDATDMTDIGVTRTPADQVEALAHLAVKNGAHGLVCSPQEVGRLRKVLGETPYLITPGVRPAGSDVGDQKRIATPAQAVKDGASALVIGRPILEAPDPYAAAMAIMAEIRGEWM